MNQRIFLLHAREAWHVRRRALLYSTVQRWSDFLRILFNISVAILRLTILDRGSPFAMEIAFSMLHRKIQTRQAFLILSDIRVKDSAQALKNIDCSKNTGTIDSLGSNRARQLISLLVSCEKNVSTYNSKVHPRIQHKTKEYILGRSVDVITHANI